MAGRALALVVLGALVAGCPVAEGPDATVTPEPRPLPDGYALDGIDAEVAMAAHRERAVESGSVTVARRLRSFERPDLVQSSDLNFTARVEWRVDFETGTYWRRTNTSSVQVAYAPPDEDWVYTYNPAREGTKVSPYGTRGPRPNVTLLPNAGMGHVSLADYLEHLNFTLAERGERTVRFESSGFENPESHEPFAGAVRPWDYENVSATLVVDYDGRIHRFTFEGDRYRGVVERRYLRTHGETVTFADYGETTVSEPEWVDEARD